jgi:hypothetical protein
MIDESRRDMPVLPVSGVEIGIDVCGLTVRIPDGVSADHLGEFCRRCLRSHDHPVGSAQGAGGGEAGGLPLASVRRGSDEGDGRASRCVDRAGLSVISCVDGHNE